MARAIPMTPVSSTNLKAIGYDSEGGILRVEFNNGHIYEYEDVPEQVFDSLMSARSKGGYLNSQIKERFNYKRIR